MSSTVVVEKKKAHSKLGASIYKRWKNCPGSVRLSEGVENRTSKYAEEGTRAHEVAEILLNRKSPDYPVTDEMLEAVMIYVNYVENLRHQKPHFAALEQKLDLSKYHPELYGTADFVCYFADTRTLHVVDYKHGSGVPVEVVESEQLMYYGLGALHANEFRIEKVILTIVQPRCYHRDGPIRSWETDAVTMTEFALQLIEDAKATEATNAPLKTGEHCRFCPASAICPEANKQAIEAVSNSFTAVADYDETKLATALKMIPQIEAWCKNVHEFAYNQAMLGNVPPGFKLVDKRAMRKWDKDVSSKTLADFSGTPENYFSESSMLSVSEVEKKMGKKEFATLLDHFVVKQSSGKTLVPDTDDRSPVKGTIENMFTTQE